MTKVSVIVPVYNTAKYLKKCLGSLEKQTLTDIEIICVNDGSTDNSLDVLNAYAEKDNRIKIINFEKNRGVYIARNQGIKFANGEYVGFVDSDDFVDLDFYEKLYTKAKATSADIVKGAMVCLDEKNQPYYSVNYDINDEIRINKAYFYHSFTSCIFNKLFIQNKKISFPEHICLFEDPYFAIQSALYCNKIIIEDEAHYFYCTRKSSETQKKLSEKSIRDVQSVIKMILRFLNDNTLSEEHMKIVTNFIHEYSLNLCLLTKSMPVIYKLAIENLKYVNENFYPRSTVQSVQCVDESTLLNEYKKYDFLNKKNMNIKVLVSYIKPSFLFKSDILTPIELGCDVEQDVSKLKSSCRFFYGNLLGVEKL